MSTLAALTHQMYAEYVKTLDINALYFRMDNVLEHGIKWSVKI